MMRPKSNVRILSLVIVAREVHLQARYLSHFTQPESEVTTLLTPSRVHSTAIMASLESTTLISPINKIAELQTVGRKVHAFCDPNRRIRCSIQTYTIYQDAEEGVDVNSAVAIAGAITVMFVGLYITLTKLERVFGYHSARYEVYSSRAARKQGISGSQGNEYRKNVPRVPALATTEEYKLAQQNKTELSGEQKEMERTHTEGTFVCIHC